MASTRLAGQTVTNPNKQSTNLSEIGLTKKLAYKIENQDYTAAGNPREIALLQDINRYIWQTKIIDVLGKPDDLFSMFLVEPVNWGDGWREMTVGLANIEGFTTDPSQRVPLSRNSLPTFVQTYEEKVQDLVRITVNNIEVKPYLQNGDALNKWYELHIKRMADTFRQRNYEFIKFLFDGQKDDNDPQKNNNAAGYFNLFQNAQMTLLAKDWKSKLLADSVKIEYDKVDNKPNEELENLVKKIIEVVAAMTLEPSDKYHLERSISGFPIRPTNENLVLIMSNVDFVNFSILKSKDYFNANLFNLPSIKTIPMNIPQGSAYVFDKRLIQIAPFFEGSYNQFFPSTLDTDFYTHLQYRAGLSKLAAFAYITKKNS